MEERARKDLEAQIVHLLDVSPSDSDADSIIVKTRTGYYGYLKILSSQGNFLAENASRSLEELIISLFEIIYTQIKIWRNCRFEN